MPDRTPEPRRRRAGPSAAGMPSAPGQWSPRLLAVLTAPVVALAVANILTVVVDRRVRPLPRELMRVLNLNSEASLGTWFSVVLMATAGVLALLCAWGAARRGERWGWLAVAGLMIVLSIDDKVQFHEKLPDYLGMQRGSMATHEWILPGILLLGAALAVVLVLGRRLPRTPRLGLLLALGVFLLGAVGLEALSGLLVRSAEVETSLLRMQVFALMVVEESLEMLGPVIAIVVIVGHLRACGVIRRPSAGTPPWPVR